MRGRLVLRAAVEQKQLPARNESKRAEGKNDFLSAVRFAALYSKATCIDHCQTIHIDRLQL